MGREDRRVHWNHVYGTKADEEVSWYEPTPERSLRWIRACALPPGAALIDVGGGTSRLAQALAEEGYHNLTVLDVSAGALARARARWRAGIPVEWIEADVTEWVPPRAYDLWHDRAVFHFLTEDADRRAYRAAAERGVRPGGWLLVATFALDGPDRCSGLPVQRHDAASIGAALGPGFALVDDEAFEHRTPSGGVQRFVLARLRRAGGA